jgi:cell division transport system permease protein
MKRTTARPRDEEPVVESRSTIGYFFREAIRRMWVSKRTSFVAVVMIAVALLILGSFLLIGTNLEAAVEQWQEHSRLTIYLRGDAGTEAVDSLRKEIEAFEPFAEQRFVSRDEALERFKSWFSELALVVDEIDENPFPASFEIEVPRATIDSPEFTGQLESLRRHPAVDDVQFDWEWIARLRRLVGVLTLAGWIAGAVLGLAAAFTIANVIRLTMFLYREEVDIMRLVGATERIIRGPFLVEGMLQGLIGGIMAIGILFGLFAAGREFLAPSGSLIWGFLFQRFLPWQTLAILVSAGMAAGLFGSWVSVREWSEDATQAVEE